MLDAFVAFKKNPWKYAFFGLLFFTLTVASCALTVNQKQQNKDQIAPTVTVPSPLPTNVSVSKTQDNTIVCQNNGQCGAGRFCYQGICQASNYCLTDTDCSPVAECQKVCQSAECATITEKCTTTSLLNKNYIVDCFWMHPCQPQQMRCVNNGCQAYQRPPTLKNTCVSSADCPAGAPCQNGYCIGVDYTN